MSYNKHFYRFYFIILCELFFLLPLILWEYMRKYISLIFKQTSYQVNRVPVSENKLYVCIHEWGGYGLTRKKTLKNGRAFECGLKFQINRFSTYKGKYNVDVTVTISDLFRYHDSNLAYVKLHSDRVIQVDNAGFDFSGFSCFFNLIKNKRNGYAILTNSSVNSSMSDFIDEYLDYMEKNQDVGALGISLAKNYNQTLVKNNFKPHIQSFFILTTIDVLNEVVKMNKSTFPGVGIKHKLLLIRQGEIMFSQLVLDLGYKLAVVQSDGVPLKFGRKHYFDNCYGTLHKYKIENRLDVANPNSINPICH